MGPAANKLVAGAACVVALAVTGPAGAATYAYNCAPDATECNALSERLEASTAATTDAANDLHADAWVLAGVIVGGAFVPMLLRELLGRRG